MNHPASMQYRMLGTTGLSVSVLGFGSWAAGGDGYLFSLGASEDSETIQALSTSVRRGVNWIDTAAIYGLGRSERLVGEVVRSFSVSKRPYVITKCGLVPRFAGARSMPERNLHPESIRAECIQSLIRLGLDYIDVYLFHWPDLIGTPIKDSWQAMQGLIEEGLVRFAGLSNFSISEMDECVEIAPVSVVQPPLSLLRRSSLKDVIPWAASNKAGVVTYSPMQSGLLTGSLTREKANQMAQDWRGQSPEVHEPLLSDCLEVQQVLRDLGEKYDVFPGVIAIAWVLEQSAVSGAIVGGRTAEQVEKWLDAGLINLEPSDRAVIEQATIRFADVAPVDPI